MRRFTAGKRPAKNFTHRCKGVAFMFSKGQQRTQRRLLHYRRIGRRHAVNVNQATWRHGDAFMPGDAGFAKCNGAGGVIKQQREIIFTRKTTQKGLVPKRLSRPWNGATIGIPTTLTKWIETNPPLHTAPPSNRYGRYDASYVAPRQQYRADALSQSPAPSLRVPRPDRMRDRHRA